MIAGDINKTRNGQRSVFVYTDTPETLFNGRVQAKKDFRSQYVRLTGPAVEAASVEEITEGNIIDEWLPRDPEDPAQLAVAEGVVVAFPVLNGSKDPDWKLIPGPATARLSEVAVAQTVTASQAA